MLVCRTVRTIVFILVGLLLALLGGISSFFWSNVFDYVLSRELALTPTSSSFQIWKDTPVPMTIKFYFFNWTNPKDLEIEGAKPAFTELGPYTFREYHEKVNITWNNNNTISYRQIKRWFFDPHQSNGSLHDVVTTLNAVAVTASYVARGWSYFLQTPMSLSFTSTGQKVAIHHSVEELLFKGYEDPIISMGSKFPLPKEVKIPYDRFGWFYERNGSASYDGMFNMHTGAGDVENVGKLLNWNYINKTKYFTGNCANVTGSAGELWPPKRKRTDKITMFSTDLCRSIWFDYTEDVEVEDIPGYRYSGGRSIVDNGTLEPDNFCYCGGSCVPSGVLNVSTCRFGAPAFISYPHFYQADQYFLNQVDGMSPEEEKHRFYVTLEPNTGIPLDVAARFQINILLDRRPYVSLFKNVPKIFFPMMWFEERASMTPEMAAQLKLLLELPTIGLSVSLTLFGIGVSVILTIVMLHICRSQYSLKKRKVEKKDVSINDLHVATSLIEDKDYKLSSGNGVTRDMSEKAKNSLLI